MSLVGQRIRERRARLRMSQSDLADRLHTSQKQISKYENGVNDPSSRVRMELARELDTTSDYLLGLTEDPYRPLRNINDLDSGERELLMIYRSQAPKERERILNVLKAMS